MSFKIIHVKDAGNVHSERLILQAVDKCNLENYMVMDRTYKDGQVSNKLRHVYQFPDLCIKKGEYVILYTRPGENSTGKWSEEDKTITHRFYWGLNTTVWNINGDVALILKYDVVDKQCVE